MIEKIVFHPCSTIPVLLKIKGPFPCGSISKLSLQRTEEIFVSWPILLSLYHHTALTTIVIMLGIVSVLTLFLAIWGPIYICVNIKISSVIS